MIRFIKTVTICTHQAISAPSLVAHTKADRIINFIIVNQKAQCPVQEFILRIRPVDSRIVAQRFQKFLFILLIVHYTAS